MPRLTIIIAVLLAAATAAKATVIQVPADQPTIQAGVNAASNGDTVLVSAGTYYEHIDFNGMAICLKAGGPLGTCVLARHPGDGPIITFDSGEQAESILDGFSITGTSGGAAIWIVNSSPTIRNNSVSDFYNTFDDGNSSKGAAIHVDNSHAIIENNRFVANHATQAGGAIGGTYFCGIVVGNTFLNNRSNRPGSALQVWTGTGAVITRNLCIGNVSERGTFEVSVVESAEISNNTIVNETNGGITVWYCDSEPIVVRNNIITGNNGWYGISAHSSYYDVDYNNVYNCSSNYYGIVPGIGSMSADPEYCNVSGHEYYLSGSSPCIDAGDPATPVPEGGGARVDMGAFEFTRLLLDFSLTLPADQDILLTQTPTLTWEELPNNTAYGEFVYDLEVDSLGDFVHPIVAADLTDPAYSFGTPLPRTGVWHWRVKGHNDTTVFSSNETFTFRVDNLPANLGVVLPANGDEVKPTDWLVWSESYDADLDDTVSYTLQVDDNSDFSSPEAAETGITDFPEKSPQLAAASAVVGIRLQDLDDVTNLMDGTVYFWRVKAVDKFGGESAFTDGTSFFSYNSVNSAPAAPTSGFSPSADASVYDLTPTISWSPGSDPDLSDNSSTLHYNLRLDDDGEVEADYLFELSTPPGVPSHEVAAALTSGTHWYYAVQTVDDEGLVSAWSALQSFWTAQQIVTVFAVEGEAALDHVVGNQPVFSWDYFREFGFAQVAYQVEVGTDNEWTQAELWNSGQITSPTTQSQYNGQSLVDGQACYLRLRLSDGGFWQPWYETSFRMNSRPSKPVVAFPPNGSTVDPQPTLYVVNATDPEGDPLSYQFEVYVNPNDPSPLAASDVIPQQADSTGWIVSSVLPDNGYYFWRSRSWDGYEYSEWSTYFFFAVNSGPEPPSTPTAVAPSGENLILYDMLPIFSWSEASDPDPFDEIKYRLELSLTPGFGLVMAVDNLTETSYHLADSLSLDTRYWWRVKAIDETGLFSTSEPSDFWTWTLGDVNHTHDCTIGDVSLMIDHLFLSETPIIPPKVGDVNATCDITIGDVSLMIDHLFISGAQFKVGCE